jgi:pyruvate ferredoxin oxidoreductase alpha subunit
MPTILQGWDELATVTGRKYAPVETYQVEGAETLILGMGSICETSSIAVDMMREKGKPVGLVNLRLWRPLPKEELRSILGKAKNVVVLDRSVCIGGASAPLTTEIRSLMYPAAQRPNISCMIAGLGGRDVTPEDVCNMVDLALSEPSDGYRIYGVRG